MDIHLDLALCALLDALEALDPENPDSLRAVASVMRQTSDNMYRISKTKRPMAIGQAPYVRTCGHVYATDDMTHVARQLLSGERSWSTYGQGSSIARAEQSIRSQGYVIDREYVQGGAGGLRVVGVVSCGVCSGEAPFGRDELGRPLIAAKGDLHTEDGAYVREAPEGWEVMASEAAERRRRAEGR